MSTNYRPDHLDRQAIAQAILALALAPRAEKIPEIKEAMENYTPRALTWLLREMHQRADFASKAAKEIAEEEMGMTLPELLDMRWDQQPMRDPGRQKLRFEHIYPIGHGVSEIMTMPELTVEGIKATLAKFYVCWVTVEEDSKLGRRYRPDPWQAYANAGIVLLDRAGRRIERGYPRS